MINICGHVLNKGIRRCLRLNIKLNTKDKFCGLWLRLMFKFKINGYD
jgi:hypothetical protein